MQILDLTETRATIVCGRVEKRTRNRFVLYTKFLRHSSFKKTEIYADISTKSLTNIVSLGDVLF